MLARFIVRSLAILPALAPFASAQDLIIGDITNGRLMRFDGATGALIDANAIDVSAITNGVVERPSEVLFAPNGELWVLDLITDKIERFAGDGSSYLGSIDVGAVDLLGGAVADGSVWIAKIDIGFGFNNSLLLQLDGDGDILGEFPSELPLDVEPYRFQGLDGLLVANNLGETIMFADSEAPASQTPFSAPPTASIPWQVHATPSGRVWLAEGLLSGTLWELDDSGTVLSEIDLQPFGFDNVRGVHELPDGKVLFTTSEGVQLLDRTMGSVTTVWSGGEAFLISEQTSGASYCPAAANSSGLPASLSARGSRAVAENDLTLFCRTMPTNAPAFFIGSRQEGFVANPAGSAGNLCLSGAIGRFVAPGQLQFSGIDGAVSLALDAAEHPTPGGAVPVSMGETWYYQCWFRDSAGGQPGSNFSNGIRVTYI